MQDADKTKERLIAELRVLRERVAELGGDKTEPNGAEGLLQTVLHRFYTVLSSLYAGVLLVSEAGRVEFANKSFCDLFHLECSPEELKGQSSSEIIEKIRSAYADPVAAINRIQVILDQDLPIKSEEVVLRDGRTCLRDFIPLVIEGKRFGRLWHHQDITERKRMEEALREQTLKLSERVKELNCLYGISHLVERPNDTVEELLQGIVSIIPPSWQYPEITCARITFDGRECRTENFTETSWRQVQDIFVHGKRLGTVEVLYLEERPDRDEGPFMKEERSLLKAIAERLGRVIERRRTKEALREREEVIRKNEAVVRSLLEATPVGVALLKNRVCVKANPALCRILGFSEEELTGSSTRISFPDDEEFNRVDRVGYGQLKREGLAILEARLKRKDGALIDVLLCLSPFDPDDATAGVAATIVDITERKRAEEERLQLEQRLHQAQKAESLGRMAGAIAHHFNSLLGAVMGRLELALGDLEEAPRPRKHLTEAMKASQRAAEISSLMLTYLGQTVQRKEPCDIVEAVREALLLLGPVLPQRVQLNAEFPLEAIMIQGDKVHIEQVMTNLLLNAREAIGDSEGQITVAVNVITAEKLRELRLVPSDWKPAENRYVSITISDTGSGFDPDMMERIFDPFFSTKFAGRGLGLAIVLGIVRAHGGALAVENQPGQGSTFRVLLPLPPEQALHPGRETLFDFEPFK